MANKTSKLGWFYSLIRISFFSGLGISIMLAAMAYLWLKETGILRMDGDVLATITEFQPVDNTIIYDRKGQKIAEAFNRYHTLVPYQKLPDALIKAMIAIEDRSFFEHQGIDLRGIARAVYDRLQGGRIRQGASTITQQVVRHFLLSHEKTLERKLREAILAIMLETKISKERIFELYANVLFLGNGSYGVGAAAHRYFDKPLAELETHQLALIAGLFQSPSRYNPQRYPNRAKKRQLQVLRAMYQSGYLSKSQYLAEYQKPLHYQTYVPLSNQVAPYFVDYVKEQAVAILGRNILNKGLRIYTTLDSDLQALAQQTFEERSDIFDLAGRLVIVPYSDKDKPAGIQGALISSDPHSGAIVAMVGGRDYDKSKFNRTYQALRQPGSSFKPIIYSLALMSGRKWSDVIYVAPIAIDNYRPRNYSRSYLTETTMLRAFYRSVNTPAVEVGYKLGLGNVLRHAYNLGVTTQLKAELGSMLGSSDVTMIDLLQVYSTIANNGVKTNLYAIDKITDRQGQLLWQQKPVEQRSQEVMSSQDTYLITEGMRAVFRYGTAYSENEMSSYAAGKTGTSNHSRDNWFSGFTNRLTTVVWVGSDRSHDFLGKATGSSLALPIWATFMKKARKLYQPGGFAMPSGIVSYKVNSQYGYKSESGQEMYFKIGQEPSDAKTGLKILSETGQFRSIFEN